MKIFSLLLGILLIFGTYTVAAPITSSLDSALVGANLIDFESQNLANFSSITIDDVTISGIGGDLRISDDSNGVLVPPADNFLDNVGSGGFLFKFTSDVSAFGIQIGATNYEQTLFAYDSAGNLLESLSIPDQYDTLDYPYTGFYGISSGLANIASFEITANNFDWIVLDDLMYTGDTAPVPEPGTLLLLGTGLLGLVFTRKRMKK